MIALRKSVIYFSSSEINGNSRNKMLVSANIDRYFPATADETYDFV